MKLVWLRRDLRSVDNTALNNAIASGEPVTAVFIATPEQWQQHHMAPRQADLIYRRLDELQKELQALNIPLLYSEVSDFAHSAQRISEIAKLFSASEVLVNQEYEVNEQKRDKLAQIALAEQGIDWLSLHDKCIVPAGSLLNKQGQYFKVFTPFKKAWLSAASIPRIQPTQSAPEMVLPDEVQGLLWSKEQPFSYPREDSSQWAADFETIRAQLRTFCQERVDDYQQRRDFPATDCTSSLSPYLAIGALSARQCMARLYAESNSGNLSQGAQTWLSELIWREFYQHLLTFEPKLCKGRDFLNWGRYVIWWQDNEKFERWCRGETGYPIVDAAMKQLNQTGWMHNRLRMIVASFLTKDLHIDWRWGERYFMSKLIDGDYAANNGGWQWCASTGCDGQPYFRIFNPITQGQKFDGKGAFVRHWIPELRSVPEKYVHAPWLWAGVNLVLYPARIVDHKAEREVTLDMYKQARDKEIHVA
ncbi:deoxyribodipyrimidine photo-lyase [Vibrio ziniensis]|uniref:Deoxyribodipyrimidine photo-lyase n=1 Tax=Vibrio ziniensis TaxID=2711221 RepID=A0A6G7CND9_9VIBR|nr:deoxyribodipyrimidine photo-lyase [Vibrio ziniensis]QIH43622.1 deoxyribodipyrimidine photo-lyase [Vibrio ziniensis]